MQEFIAKARVLVEALPYISQFRGKTMVVKIGGAALEDEALRTSVAFTKQLHETLVKRLGEASLLRNAGGYEVEAIEPPTPARKIGPSLRLFAVLGAFVGALLGLVLAYLKEQRRRDPESPTIVATAKVTTTAPTESALVLQPSTVATP